jgi:hypothetical protein
MSGNRRLGTLIAVAAAAVGVVALAAVRPAATGAPREPQGSAPRVASVVTSTTRDFRVAVVAQRVNGGATPTADVRVAVARRAGAGWREVGERRLAERYFWNTVTGPRAVCRLAVATAGAGASFRPYVAVQLLLSPSLGCGRTHRVPLAAG